jgi:hypothetical protein
MKDCMCVLKVDLYAIIRPTGRITTDPYYGNHEIRVLGALVNYINAVGID